MIIKTLTKPAIGNAILFMVLGLIWFFTVSFLSFVHESESQEYVRIINICKDLSILALVTLGIYFYHKQSKNKPNVLQEQYFDLFTAHSSPMAIVDIQTKKFLAVNKASTECYGYSAEEFLLLKVSDIRDYNEEKLWEQNISALTPDFRKSSIRMHRKKNGEVILTEVSSSEIYFKNRKCALLLSTDITERVKAKEGKRIAEEEKTKQQNFTSYILENFPVDVAIFDKDHRYTFINKTAIKNDEMRKWMIGKDDFDYFRAKGSDVSMAEKRRERFLKAVSGQSTEWIDEYKVDGKIKYMLRNFFPCYQDGQLQHVYGYGMDITEVKKAQLQRDEYIQQLENMAFITSHKIRQPICNIQGLITLLEMEKTESKEVQNIISCMQKSVTSMDDYTRDLAVKLHQYKQHLTPNENNI